MNIFQILKVVLLLLTFTNVSLGNLKLHMWLLLLLLKCDPMVLKNHLYFLQKSVILKVNRKLGQVFQTMTVTSESSEADLWKRSHSPVNNSYLSFLWKGLLKFFLGSSCHHFNIWMESFVVFEIRWIIYLL